MKSKKKDPKAGVYCPVCTKPVPEVALKYNDPFCSAPCCRKYHGHELGRMTQEVKVGSTKLRQAA